jgi:hypothetical protein
MAVQEIWIGCRFNQRVAGDLSRPDKKSLFTNPDDANNLGCGNRWFQSVI